MTTAQATIEGIIAEVVAEQKAKWGTLLNCCEDTCWEVCSRAREQFIFDVETVEGFVQIKEGGEVFPHHWLNVYGEDVDPTAEQFGLSGYSVETHYLENPEG